MYIYTYVYIHIQMYIYIYICVLCMTVLLSTFGSCQRRLTELHTLNSRAGVLQLQAAKGFISTKRWEQCRGGSRGAPTIDDSNPA